MNARDAALSILTAFDSTGKSLDGLIDHTFAAHHIDHRDRRFAYDVVYGVMRRRGTLDYVIARFLDNNDALKQPGLRNILRIGAYQILYMDRVPDHAAVNEAVNAAKSSRKLRYYAGLVNALLRNIIKHRKQPIKPSPAMPLAGRLSLEHSHPSWLVERWLDRFGLGDTKKLLAFNNARPQVHLRRRMRGVTRQQFEFDVRPICGNACGLLNLYYPLVKSLQPDQIAVLERGDCVIQSPSSGWVVAMLDIQPGDRLLDLCSAPGGKSTLAAEFAGPEGRVCACDISPDRLRRVTETIRRMKLRTVIPLAADGRKPPFAGYFDKVLVDAPCSGTGVLHRHPEARWNRTMDSIREQARLQGELLDSAMQLLKPDGILVYATCSMEKEENEEVVEAFLSRHEEVSREKPPLLIPANCSTNDGYLRITPWAHGFDGMFAARMKKSARHAG